MPDNDHNPSGTRLMKILQPMIQFNGRIERGTIDLTRPRTEIERLKKQIDTSLEGADISALVTELGALLQTVTAEDIADSLADLPPRPKRRRCDMLNEYFDLVEADAPLTLGIIFGGSKLIGLDFVAKSLDALGKLREAARGSGEIRIEALRIAAGFVLESMYKEMITVLYEIEGVRRSRQITPGECQVICVREESRSV